ncbi:MAG TPA: hypothetical protein VJB65_04600, partial [Patescibacteria group bacterium]|nr:hypothetical protein [Patescibacteria group bacterium]
FYAERMFPGVPKVMIRNSQICHLCANTSRDIILQLLQKKQYRIIPHIKLEAKVGKKKLLGLNDIVVGHKHMTQALRARVHIDQSQYIDEFLGDGIVVSTPLGSTGYYQSITRSNFQAGLGVAFNNSVNIVSHLVVSEQSIVEVRVLRGPGVLVSDNAKEEIRLNVSDRVAIRVAKQQAHIVQFDREYRHLSVNAGTNRVPVGFCQICHRVIENSL